MGGNLQVHGLVVTMFAWNLETLVVTMFAWHTLWPDQYTQVENSPFYSLFYIWQNDSNINMYNNKYQTLVTMAPIYWRTTPGKCDAVDINYYFCHLV